MRLSLFTNIFKDANSYILHNTLHNTLMTINKPELRQYVDRLEQIECEARDETNTFQGVLVQQNMLVEDDADEISLLNYRLRQTDPHKLQFTLNVTRNCNFGCPYCLQAHMQGPEVMQWEVYENSILAIAEMAKQRACKSVWIRLFGGEPTLEYENICRFMHALRQALPEHVDLVAHMTTNGYLLDKEKFENLIKLNVKSYQITLDGLSDTHDASRFLIGGQGTWNQIVQNMMSWKTSRAPFSVMIRTNFTKAIVDEADAFFDAMQTHFGDDKRFYFYFECVKGDHVDYSMEEAFVETGPLIRKARDRGLPLNWFESILSLRGLTCYLSDPDAYFIDYGGNIAKCTIYFDHDEFIVGRTSGGRVNLNEEKYAKWSLYEIDNRCKSCSIYPLCLGRFCPMDYFDPKKCSIAKNLYHSTLQNLYVHLKNHE